MTETPPGGPDRDPFGQPVQASPTQGPPGYPPQQWYPTYPPHQPYPPGMPPRGGDADNSRTKAVWALVLAILPLCGISWIVALVLAILVLSGPRDGQRHGRGMAWASIVIVVVWIVGSVIAVVAIIATLPADRDGDGNVVSGGEIFPESLRVGDCLDEDLSSARAVGVTVTVVPCGDLHSGEVYLEVDIDQSSYPSRSEIQSIAEPACEAEFADWVGTAYGSSELDFTYFYPTSDNWEYDQQIRCIVVPPDEVTGTLEGSER